MELAQIKDFLQIDFDDDVFITLCKSAADAVVIDAVGIEKYEVSKSNERFKSKFDLLSLMITREMYDNRSLTCNEEKINEIAEMTFAQLKYGVYEVADET